MNSKPAKCITLVVDDNPVGLYATSRTLGAEGFEIITASTGQEALMKAKEKPDIIVLDVKLPDISGFEVCRRIKSDPDTSAIPVIHLSATYLDYESKAQGLEMGADAYLTHPVEPRVLTATINAMLRIRNAEMSLKEAAMKWQATFDAINDGVCLLNSEFNIDQCNKAFEMIVGKKQDEIVGRRLCDICKALCSFDTKYFRSTTPESEEIKNEEMLVNGAWYLISTDLIPGGGGTFSGAVFKMTNISPAKHAEDELKKTMVELERSNKELEQFAYIASHDLQEPLRMVSNFTQLLGKRYSGRLDPDADTMINFAVDGAKRMQMLITDLLTFSRVTTRGMSFESVDLNEVLSSVEKNLQMTIKETGAEIKSDHLPVVKADAVQMSQLFQNLISNAIKFRSERNPVVTIKAEASKGEWIFSVSDNGIGIDPQFKERIFVIFQRLHDMSEYPGTGIGLAICKKIVERHRGRIWVESESGEGSTFYFTLGK
ncbi:MAG: response regulator [Ignavibacteria bacterium]|jgi:PAS domain S-box-containing protein|nr:response regulator [Ignavibacteria bacterium]MCU7514473.1 response regulator [Ignavibacteria bacterium]MCU7522315.1 response regulator [Ignavibacteria bacterium]MCU7525556.1 response regulator [Ignavibacteria bacterium]